MHFFYVRSPEFLPQSDRPGLRYPLNHHIQRLRFFAIFFAWLFLNEFWVILLSREWYRAKRSGQFYFLQHLLFLLKQESWVNFKETGQRIHSIVINDGPFGPTLYFRGGGSLDPMWIRHGQFGLFFLKILMPSHWLIRHTLRQRLSIHPQLSLGFAF